MLSNRKTHQSINQSIKSQEKKFKGCNATELFPVKAVDMLCTSDILTSKGTCTGQLMNSLSLHMSQGISSFCHVKRLEVFLLPPCIVVDKTLKDTGLHKFFCFSKFYPHTIVIFVGKRPRQGSPSY